MKHFSTVFERAARVGRLAVLFTWGRGLLLAVGLAAGAAPVAAQSVAITGPVGSVAFGRKLTVLTNGNFVVADPDYNGKRGAVYLYDGKRGGKISTLTGSNANDQVGSGGIVALPGGDFVVSSPDWNMGTATNGGYGAVTWGDGTNGMVASVSSSNSLVGSTAGDRVGYDDLNPGGLVVLPNGNYLVHTPNWSSSGASGAGAVTWANGTTGVKGIISTSNSLVGSHAYDFLGADEYGSPNVVALPNSNYLVVSPHWNSTPGQYQSGYGAVTWGDGAAGVKGTVSTANSLVGSTTGDHVGNSGVTFLTNGNYLVISIDWGSANAADLGAVTWGSSTAGVKGVVSNTNSLVGSTPNDQVGILGVLKLTNGNYVVVSPRWNNRGVPGPGGAASAGAVTWGSGTVGVKGTVTATNSLVGSTADDRLGSNDDGLTVSALPNGNYVVFSPLWDNRTATVIADAGALTLGDGQGNTVGTVTACNSIVGSTANEGTNLVFAYSPVTNKLLGGLPAENKVVVGVGAPSAPTGSANQSYTPTATVADLKATGTGIQWYGTASGSSKLLSTAPLTNGSTYYATQTVGGCESLNRLAVTVAAPLPVQLLTFTATASGPAAVHLAWATASEKNSAAFEVERSIDGTAFAHIGTVAAAGSSNSSRTYELLDAQLPAGATLLYYRLHLLDLDGTSSYSPVRTVTLPGATAGLTIFPNPTPGGAATLTGAQPGTVVSVLDALGRSVTTTLADATGTAALVLPAGLPAGVYVVRVGTQALRLTVE